MKKVNLKLFSTLCLLTACSNIFAQEITEHECEIVVTRADIERCAMYKRTNVLLEHEIKFQAVAAVSQKDSSKALENKLYSKINRLNDNNLQLNTELANKKATIRKLWSALLVGIIAFLLIFLFSIFKSKLAKFIPFLSLISLASFAQDPMYRPPVSINGQKGVTQKIVLDSTANNFSILSQNDVHTIRIPANRYQSLIPLSNITKYYRGDKTWQTLDKIAVLLPNVDNTSDINKPISTAAQSAFNGKENTISAGTTAQYYRGDKTWQSLDKAAVALGSVENTALSTWSGTTNITTIGAATASGTFRVGASTPYMTMFNYFGTSPRITSSSTLDFLANSQFIWYTPGDIQIMKLSATGLKLGTGSAAYKLDVSGDMAYQGLIYVGNPSRGVSLSSGSVGQFLRKSTITDGYFTPLTINQWANIGTADISDWSSSFDSRLGITLNKFNNVTILDSASFTHSLSSTKLAVMFYEAQTKEVNFIDWVADTSNTIKVYLPLRDKPTKYKFVGDVYIIKRY